MEYYRDYIANVRTEKVETTCFLRRYDIIKTWRWNFFRFSLVVHYRVICKYQVFNQEFIRKDDLHKHVFPSKNWCSPKSVFFLLILTVTGPVQRMDFKWKKYGGTALTSEKTEALWAELNERVEAATSCYSAKGNSLQCIYSVLVAKNQQKF